MDPNMGKLVWGPKPGVEHTAAFHLHENTSGLCKLTLYLKK